MSNAIAESWYRVQWETVLAKHYPQTLSVSGVPNITKNPLLEYLLPSLLYVKTVAVLDDALATYIDAKGWTIPKPLRNDLYGRITFMTGKGLSNPPELHRMRDRRNAVAHEA